MIGKLLQLPFLLAGKVLSLAWGSVRIVLGTLIGVVRFLLGHVVGSVLGATIGFLLGNRHIGVKLFPGSKKKKK